MSSKNTLQELFQKRKESLPQYKTIRRGGPDNAPKWSSKVILPDGSSYESSIMTSKKEAEIEAASLALESLEKALPQTISLEEETLLLVDLENEGNFFTLFENYIFSNLEIISFSSKVSATPDIPSWVKHLKVGSSHRDSADVGIIMMVTKRMFFNVPKRIIILTHDHFVYPIKDLVETDLLETKKRPEINIFSEPEELLRFLKTK